jgi:hypothetical protein
MSWKAVSALSPNVYAFAPAVFGLIHDFATGAPWHVVNADDKKRARFNCIRHLLDQIPYQDMRPVEIELPLRQSDTGYKRPKKSSQRFTARLY